MRDHSDKLLQAQGLVQMGQFAQARDLLLRTLQRGGGAAKTNAAMARMLSQVLLQQGQREQGLYYAERAAASGDPDALLHHAHVLWTLGRAGDAVNAARAALAAAPANRNAHGTLVNYLVREDRFGEALQAASAAIARFPGDPEFLSLRANMLLGSGRPEAAVAELRGLVERTGADPRVLGTLGPALNYLPGADAEEVRRIHDAYGAAMTAALAGAPAPIFRQSRDPARRIRLGLMSPDLRRHAMWHFVYPMLAHLDREQFDLRCYFTGAHPDAGTESLRAAGGEWRHVPAMHIGQLAEQIRADGVDILVDLAGHTRFHRLGVMALRAAPVQMNFTGYPCTTGVPATDYHVTDSTCSPPGSEAWFSERLLRVDPIFFCYQPPLGDETPPVADPPCVRNGFITFGSFNTLMKLNDRVVATWARLLATVPGSHLLLKNLQFVHEEPRNAVRERFRAAGVPDDRLEIVGHQGTTTDHLAAYSRVDIALDPFPYAGMTTTCEALLMGVPVVSLPQQSMASRVGKSILNAVDLNDFAAESEDDYVRFAATLADSRDRLHSLRSTLRSRLLESPLGNGPHFGSRFGTALRAAWRTWCEAASA